MRTYTKGILLGNFSSKFFCLMLILCLGVGSSWGQTTKIWTGATSGAWLTAGNWNTSGAPATTSTEAFFNINTSTTNGINMNGISAANSSIGCIHWGSSATTARTVNNSSTTVSGVFTLNGMTINSVANTILRNNSTATHTITDGSSQTLGIALGNTTNNIINIDGTGGITISSIISGANPLTKGGSGTGVLTLSATNTYTGATTISSGFINATGESAFGANPGSFTANRITLNGGGIQSSTGDINFNSNRGITLGASGGTFDAASGRTITALNVITGSGALTKSGAGSLVMTGQHAYTGLTTVSAGTLQLIRTGGTTLPVTNNVTVSGGTLRVSAAQTLNNLTLSSGTLTVDAGVTLTINGTLTYSGGTISGTGTIVYGTSGAIVYSANKTTGIEWTASNTPASVSITAGTLTLGNNVTTTGNITISGTGILAANTRTINIGGNWTNRGTIGFTEGTSTVNFNGTGSQAINTTGGEEFFVLTKSAAGTTTLSSNVALSGTSSAFNLSAGIFNAGTFTFSGTASTALNISGGTLQLGKLSTTLPEFANTAYNNTDGTIELNGAGSQVLRGARNYENLTFSTSGIKTISSAVSSITGLVTIQTGVTLNVGSDAFPSTNPSNTSLTINGTGKFINGGGSTKPDISGTYILASTSTIEFSGSSATIIRVAPTYGNIDISGSDVSLSGTGTSLTLQSGSSFTVKNGGVFNVKNVNGFSGASNTAIDNTNSPNIVLESGSTINYNDIAQPITSGLIYSNLTISGSGIKDAASAFTVNDIFTRSGTATLGTTSPTYGASSTLAYVDATDAQAYTAGLEWPATNSPFNVTVNLSGATNPSVTLAGDRIIGGVFAQTAGMFKIDGHTLTLNGTVTGAGTLQGSLTSNLSIGGTGSLGTLNFDQTTDGTSNALSNLTINRTTSGTVTLGNKLLLIDVLTPTDGVLNSGGFLHLRSTLTNTARIAQGPSAGNYITGDVTVERFITATGNRAYRLITPTVTTSTSINANWQEGKANAVVNVNVPSDEAGYGTHITGAGGSSNGFDATQTNQGSLFTYTYNPDAWTLVTNTNVNTLDANKGYLLFVRGNRDNISTINTATGNSSTTLRAKGTLVLGNQTLNNANGNGNVTLIANPYASPIRWDAASGLYTGINATNFENYITIWDPNIGTRGGYVTITNLGDTTMSAPGTSLLTRDIQSGQAFFVQAKAATATPCAFEILETHKATINNLDVYRSGTQTELLKTILFFTDANGIRRAADGVTNAFSNNFSNNVDGNDAEQIDNWDEDIYINRGTKNLSIETRKLVNDADTIPITVARLKRITYQWEFQPENFNAPGLQAFLKDNFTNTSSVISLNNVTVIPFTVTTDAASSAANRFSIIFKAIGTLPVTIKNIKAYTKNNGVQIDWQVSNEINIAGYEVEKSSDAINFTKLNSQSATAANSYSSFDAATVDGNNYYRIKVLEKSGIVSYTQIIKVSIGKKVSIVSVYPNPIKNNQIGIQLSNIAKGNYQVRITNSIGQTVHKQVLAHTGGSATQYLHLGKQMSNGSYQIVIDGTNLHFVQTILKE